jgi:hypothetical protein
MDDNGIIFYCLLLKDVNQNECCSLIDKDILWWSSLIYFKECVLSVLLNGEQKTKIIYSPNKKNIFHSVLLAWWDIQAGNRQSDGLE